MERNLIMLLRTSDLHDIPSGARSLLAVRCSSQELRVCDAIVFKLIFFLLFVTLNSIGISTMEQKQISCRTHTLSSKSISSINNNFRYFAPFRWQIYLVASRTVATESEAQRTAAWMAPGRERNENLWMMTMMMEKFATLRVLKRKSLCTNTASTTWGFYTVKRSPIVRTGIFSSFSFR